jgi:hypothetical protein
MLNKTCSGQDNEGNPMIAPRTALDHFSNPQTLATFS